jgi:hypothetical protein
MGSPISGTLAEIYLQQIEELYIKHWRESHETIYYKRYVDDTLIIFDQHRTNETTITSIMNKINEQLEFKTTKEINKSINYLGLTIKRNINNIELDKEKNKCRYHNSAHVKPPMGPQTSSI